MTKINLKDPKQLQKYALWILGIVIVSWLLNPDSTIQLGTSSVFGVGGITLSIGVILLALGIGLIFLPGGGIVIGPLFIAAAWLITGGAVISQLSSLFSSLTGVLIIGAILVGMYVFLKK